MKPYEPRFLKTKKTGLLANKIELAYKILEQCTLCPRNCRVNRLSDECGVCATGADAIVSSFAPHFGEEPMLVGHKGSGTLFFTYCNLKCCFCQNYDISFKGEGRKASPEQIASIMLNLKKLGCHNINLVTPSHVVPFFLKGLDIAIDHGLDLPIIYNCSGYESIETLKILEGTIDIYMPDFKFWDSDVAKKLCNAPDYPETARLAIKEMHRQTGDLKMDSDGIAVSGLLVRHLVLPDNMADTYEIMKFIKQEISENTYVNVMSQYRPMGDAHKVDSISKPITPKEFREAREVAKSFGLNLIR